MFRLFIRGDLAGSITQIRFIGLTLRSELSEPLLVGFYRALGIRSFAQEDCGDLLDHQESGDAIRAQGESLWPGQ